LIKIQLIFVQLIFVQLNLIQLNLIQLIFVQLIQIQRQTWSQRKRTVASCGITGSELNRLWDAVRFMQLHRGHHRGELWWVTTDDNTARSLIHNVWKRVTRLQGDNGFPQYSVAVLEGRRGVHAHIIFIGNRAVAQRLKSSTQFGDLIHVARVTDAERLVRGYLSKERTAQAGYRREHVFGGRLSGSHRLEGGGDRVRLSRQLERDAIEAEYVSAWQHTNARRTSARKPYQRRPASLYSPTGASQ
jgi:hypothetical protein